MSIHLTCSACGAPLETDGATTTVRCPFCDSVVVVPDALRPTPSAPAPQLHVREERVVSVRRAAAPRREPQPKPQRRARGCMVAVFIFFLLAILAGVLAPLWFASTRSATELTSFTFEAPATLAPQVTPSPTPGFAAEVARFGSAGIGPGYLDDARAIALDQAGALYVGDYSSGRVQRLDEAGAWQSQWLLPEESYVGHFVVDRAGQLYTTIGAELLQFDGATGTLVRNLTEGSDQWATDGLALTPDGRIVVELDDDVVRLAADGTPDLVIADAIESAGGEHETSTLLAVDGRGNIFALATTQEVVYKFSPDGRFLDRFGEQDWLAPGGGKFASVGSLAIDPQGRVYVGDSNGIQVFNNDGGYLGLIDVDGYPFGMAFNAAGRLFVTTRDAIIEYEVKQG